VHGPHYRRLLDPVTFPTINSVGIFSSGVFNTNQKEEKSNATYRRKPCISWQDTKFGLAIRISHCFNNPRSVKQTDVIENKTH
jgi:hypothetical protein